jgi:hypothetical protein
MTSLDRTKLGMVAAMALGAACSSGQLGGTGTDSTGTTTVTRPKTAAASSSATTGAGGMGSTSGAGGMGGMGGSAPACNPPAAAGTFWAQSAQQYGNPNPVSMCDYRGDVLLVVNTADV